MIQIRGTACQHVDRNSLRLSTRVDAIVRIYAAKRKFNEGNAAAWLRFTVT